MKKIFRKFHLWLSVPLGIFITMLCFSGATLVYEQEITQCLRRLYYVDEVKPATLPVDTLMARVQAPLPLTGYYLWLRRLKNRRTRQTRE